MKKHNFIFKPSDRGEKVTATAENSARNSIEVIYFDEKEKKTSFLNYAESVRVFAFFNRPLKRNKEEAEAVAAAWLELHKNEFEAGRADHISRKKEEKFAFEFVRIKKEAEPTSKNTEETEETPTRSTLPEMPPAQIEPEPAIMSKKAVPCSLADAADMLKMREFTYTDKQGILRSLDLRGVEKCTTWQALHDEDGILRYHTEKDEEGRPHRVYHFRNIAESFLRFSRSLLDTPEGQAAWKSCGGGNIVGYDQQNPARICGMAALWGLENIGGQFFRTPRAWKNSGYELKPTARPFFVVTPKFSQKNEKTTDEETGEEVEQITITGAAGKFNMFPVYCSADVVQVREIKRREPRKAAQSAESAELAAAYAEARQEVATATATTGAPRQNVIVALASPSKTRQLTLAL